MEKYISVNKEGMKKLMATFRVGERCIKNALAYRSSNELARKIRYTAVKCYDGCTYYVGRESEIFFDSDSSMRCVCPNKAEIYFDKATGEGIIYDPKGNVAVRYENVPVSKIGEMQRFAESLK